MLAEYWPNVIDGGPTFSQNWFIMIFIDEAVFWWLYIYNEVLTKLRYYNTTIDVFTSQSPGAAICDNHLL